MAGKLAYLLGMKRLLLPHPLHLDPGTFAGKKLPQDNLFQVPQDFGHSRQGSDFPGSALSVTAGNPDVRLRIVPGQSADGLARLLVSPGRYGTGINDYQVRSGLGGQGDQALTPQRLSHSRGLVLVHLAPESDYLKVRHIDRRISKKRT